MDVNGKNPGQNETVPSQNWTLIPIHLKPPKYKTILIFNFLGSAANAPNVKTKALTPEMSRNSLRRIHTPKSIHEFH